MLRADLQWTKLLDRVADGLDECNIRYGRLDGSMHRDARTRAMDSFREDPTCEVLLVSLRAGGVGLNLTMASRVYLMEPFWNPAVENQATDRIHRLGQQKSVKLTRYIVKDSIEANMMEIQKRKMELANLSMSQTLPKQELAARRIENLKVRQSIMKNICDGKRLITMLTADPIRIITCIMSRATAQALSVKLLEGPMYCVLFVMLQRVFGITTCHSLILQSACHHP